MPNMRAGNAGIRSTTGGNIRDMQTNRRDERDPRRDPGHEGPEPLDPETVYQQGYADGMSDEEEHAAEPGHPPAAVRLRELAKRIREAQPIGQDYPLTMRTWADELDDITDQLVTAGREVARVLGHGVIE